MTNFRGKFVLPVGTLLVLLIAPKVWACSCAWIEPGERFARVENVFTAVITSAEFVACPDRNPEWKCTDYRAGFETTKVFKGDIPFRFLTSHLGGGSCGTSLIVGQEYLFFAGATGATGLCSGTMQVSPENPRSAQTIELIERYLANDTPDLSSPWGFSEEDGLCTLSIGLQAQSARYHYRTGGLTITYRVEPADNVDPRYAEFNVTGYAGMLLRTGEPRAGDGSIVTLEADGARYYPEFMDLDAERRLGGFVLTGKDVLDILDRLTTESRIRVQGEVAQRPVDSMAKASNSADAIEQMQACRARH